MYDYKFVTARKQQREAVMEDMHGWRLHTAQLTNTGMWEFIFERSSTPPVPTLGQLGTSFEEMTGTSQEIDAEFIKDVPPRKKPGRKPKIKMGDV